VRAPPAGRRRDRHPEKARVLWYAACGVTAVSNGIIVHADLIKEDPELIS